MQIGNIKVGTSQWSKDSPVWLKVFANTLITISGIVATVVAVMPNAWITTDVRVFILSVCGPMGLVKPLEKLTGVTQTPELGSKPEENKTVGGTE